MKERPLPRRLGQGGAESGGCYGRSSQSPLPAIPDSSRAVVTTVLEFISGIRGGCAVKQAYACERGLWPSPIIWGP